jgi:hypothetical protein
VPDWKQVREASARLAGDGPEESGWLRQLDKRCLAVQEPPVSEWWHGTLRDFWSSGRTFLACEKGQRSQASTTFARALMVEAFMRERTLVLDQIGICSLVAVTTRETDTAVGRTIESVLKALGLHAAKRDDPTPETYVATTTDWRALDAGQRSIAFQIRPPNKGASAAGTFVGYLADEVNLWRKDQTLKDPADKVLEILMGRLAFQPGAHGYHTSTPEGKDGALSTIIRASVKAGSESLYVVRLGELGARRDEQARAGLRTFLARRAKEAPEAATRESCARWAADERLARDPDPRSSHVPTWAARGGDPVEEILECWRLVDVALRDGREGGDSLDVLLHRYGAQPGGDEGRRLFSPAVLAEARARPVVW